MKETNSNYHCDVSEEDCNYEFMKTIMEAIDSGQTFRIGSKKTLDIFQKQFSRTYIANSISSYSSSVVENQLQQQNATIATMSQVSIVNSMGAGSQTEIQLSQFRGEFDFDCNSDASGDHSVQNKVSIYHQLQPVFQKLVSQTKTQADADEVIDMMQKLTFKFSSRSLTKRKFAPTDTTFLGEIQGQRSQDKRFKSLHEK